MLIALSLILLSAAQAADYLYQADIHGWTNPVWVNGTRAKKKWGMWDWIPHDGWHIAQTIKNTCDIAGAVLLFIEVNYYTHVWFNTGYGLWHILLCLVVCFAIRALPRVLFFSLPCKYLKKHPELGKKPPVSIVVNGIVIKIESPELSYDDIVALAFLSPSRTYTIVYERGDRKKPVGTIVRGEKLTPVNGMLVHVSLTTNT